MCVCVYVCVCVCVCVVCVCVCVCVCARDLFSVSLLVFCTFFPPNKSRIPICVKLNIDNLRFSCVEKNKFVGTLIFFAGMGSYHIYIIYI